MPSNTVLPTAALADSPTGIEVATAVHAATKGWTNKKERRALLAAAGGGDGEDADNASAIEAKLISVRRSEMIFV